MSRQETNILETIHSSYYKLSAAERKIADYVLAHHGAVQFMSITQLASESGTAEATVSRFCKQLDLKGFNAFKIALAKIASPDTNAQAHSHNLEGRRNSIRNLAIEAVDQTLELLDENSVNGAVELIEKAKRVQCMGSGGSMITAMECAHLFSTVSSHFNATTDAHRQISTVATMDKDDVLLLFSYSGATTQSLQLLELAQNAGVPSILVTRFKRSPAAKLADIVLCCGSSESPFQLGSMPAKIAQMTLIDVLFQEYCHRNSDSCRRHIELIAAALSEKHV